MLSTAISNLASEGSAWNEASLHTVRDMIYPGVTCWVKWEWSEQWRRVPVEMEILGVCPGWALLWALNQKVLGVVQYRSKDRVGRSISGNSFLKMIFFRTSLIRSVGSDQFSLWAGPQVEPIACRKDTWQQSAASTSGSDLSVCLVTEWNLSASFS